MEYGVEIVEVMTAGTGGETGLGVTASSPSVFWRELVTRIWVGIRYPCQKSIKILEVGSFGSMSKVINGLQCRKLLCCSCDQELVHGVTVLRCEFFDRTMEGIGNTDG